MDEIYVKHLPDGTKLQGGKYEIVRFINSGGFGCTYEAWFPMLHTRVAIKEFFMGKYCVRDQQTGEVAPSTEDSRAIVDRCRNKFVEEASTLYGMRHRSIVRVADIFEENGTAYFAMDYIAGRTLSEIVRDEGPMPEQKAIDCMRQICDALDYLHSGNRLHLDIKPDNIMIDETGRAVLIDFGASKYLDNASVEERRVTSNVVQTPGFTPNEQLTGDLSRFTNATDLYALGATLYYVLSGVTPVSGTLRSAGEELDPLPVHITESTVKAVEKAMMLAKTDRPQTAKEFNALLKDVPADYVPPKPAQPKPVQPKPEAPKPKPEQPKPEVRPNPGFTPDAKTKPGFVPDSHTKPMGRDQKPTAPFGGKSGAGSDKPTSVFDIPSGKHGKSGKSKDKSKEKVDFPSIKNVPSESRGGGSKRKPMLIGAAVLGVVVIAAIFMVVGGRGEPAPDYSDTIVSVEPEIVEVDSLPTDVPVVEEVVADDPETQAEEEPIAPAEETVSTEVAPSQQEAKPEAQPEQKVAEPSPQQLMKEEFNLAMSLSDKREKQQALIKLADKRYAPAYAPLAKVSFSLYDDDMADKYARLAIAAGQEAEVRPVVNALASQGYYDDPAHGVKP